MIKFIITLCFTVSGLVIQAQNWVAPDGGYHNQVLQFNMWADNINNVLYRFGGDTNVLQNNKWHHWYNSSGVLNKLPCAVFTYTNGKNYSFRHFLVDNDNSKKHSALIRWTNEIDLDTVKVFKGFYWFYGEPIYLNNIFNINVMKDSTIGYDNFLTEFDGIDFPNKKRGLGDVIIYNNELYSLKHNEPNSVDLLVFRNASWITVSKDFIKGPNYSVSKMIVYNNRLYIMGGFWQIEGSLGNSIMAWDGNKWDLLGGGIQYWGAYLSGGVQDAVVCNNKLFLVGPFDHAGGMKATKVVSWNDTSWCAIAGDLNNCGEITQIECLKDTVYIEGQLWNLYGNNVGIIGKLMKPSHVDSCKSLLSSISELSLMDHDFSIYPNPVIDKLKICNSANFNNPDIEIFNNIGQLVFSAKAYDIKNEISTADLPNGVYYLNLIIKESRKGMKFLKE